jgi:hypothetical protein
MSHHFVYSMALAIMLAAIFTEMATSATTNVITYALARTSNVAGQ